MGFLIILLTLLYLSADIFLDKFGKQIGLPIDLIKNNRRWVLIIPLAIGFIIAFNPFVHNDDGERTYVLDPIFKNEKIVFEPGWSFGGFFKRTTEYPDVMSTVLEDIPIRFNDATQAKAQANIRWELPKDQQSMIDLHKAYRSPDKLQSRTLTPYSQECLAFSAQLMESETHYSGGQSKLKEDFRDQLLNGQYVLETNTSFEFDSIVNERIKITEVDIRKDAATQLAIRIPSDVQTYGIKAVFAAVPHVDYEPIVDEKLKAKIDQSTKESIAKQALITAEQEALTAEAEGRRKIAQTKATYEAEKIQAVIEAQKAKEVAAEEAQKAKFVADKVEQEGRAQAAANRALVDAGLTPEQRMKMDIEIADKVSANLAKVQFPSMMVIGGSGGGDALNPFDAVGLESFLRIQKEFTTKKRN